ncbi:hypothetical protein U9M48_030637 [Paspalum notatum var. saurae]|uniref:FAR1 domain-containing protein n=1 Tax=Paspalum notatum var. saurae TaxID=547442 RepID=A0AAQ3U589_PASNO
MIVGVIESTLVESVERSSTDRVLITSFSCKKRKRGTFGPDSRMAAAAGTAISRALNRSSMYQSEYVFAPKEGDEFSSCEEAKEFYNLYSWEVGFGIHYGSPPSPSSPHHARLSGTTPNSLPRASPPHRRAPPPPPPRRVGDAAPSPSRGAITSSPSRGAATSSPSRPSPRPTDDADQNPRAGELCDPLVRPRLVAPLPEARPSAACRAARAEEAGTTERLLLTALATSVRRGGRRGGGGGGGGGGGAMGRGRERGINREARTATCKTSCRAMICLLRTEDHGWYISRIHTEHNHALSVRCGEKKQWNSHGEVDPLTKEFIRKLRTTNISIGCVCSILGVGVASAAIPLRREVVQSVCAKLAQDDIKDDIGKTISLLQDMRCSDPLMDVRFRLGDGGEVEAMLWCTGKNKNDY